MVQRSSAASVPASSLSNTSISAAADVVESWHTPATKSWFEAARQTLALPATAGSFALFILVLALIAAATFLQVLLSAQILGAELRIDTMQAKLDSVEQQNAELGWQIAMVSQLDSVAGRARAAGFVPIDEPVFVERSAALDASSTEGPQSFYAELPQTVTDMANAPGAAPAQWFAGIEGRFRQAIEQTQGRLIAGADGIRDTFR